MLTYIFLIIAVLLIIKPTVNAQFLSQLGVEQLPYVFLLVAATALISSFFYSKALIRISLNKIIEITLISSVLILLGLGILLRFNLVSGWLLYFFYTWVAIYAVLSASQFWLLANLVFNLREAKRLFGFIGSGAIAGGIFGGYLTSILAPVIGNENLMLLAAFLLLLCIPILRNIWHSRVKNLNVYKQKKRTDILADRPFRLIRNSKHLTYLACVVATGVLVAKLVDYLFSDFAAAAIQDPEELTSFFAFWFSTFNVLSLGIQLFFTHRVVGVWGVGFSLFLLPVGIFASCLLFFIVPELFVVVLIKGMDGVLKQSLNKSAMELLALPLPFDLKNKTKSFIDVVVDSIATGIAGCILIFVVKGLELPSSYIAAIIMALVGVWLYFIGRVRKEYFRTFRNNLEFLTKASAQPERVLAKKPSVIQGMRTVFKNGTEEQVLFMLEKLMEINDKRFENDLLPLLSHSSTTIRTKAIQNLSFINKDSIPMEVMELLHTDDDDLTLATLQFLLQRAGKRSDIVYDVYLRHENEQIAHAALLCLAREARDNELLRNKYALHEKLDRLVQELSEDKENRKDLIKVLKIIGHANMPEYYPIITASFKHNDPLVVETAIMAAENSMHPDFVFDLMFFLEYKHLRKKAIAALQNYGPKMLVILFDAVNERLVPLRICRYIPMTIASFNSQRSLKTLLQLLDDTDLAIRLEVIRALSDIRKEHPDLKFDKYKIVAAIFEECQLHHQTLSAMHTQIIISYRNRKRTHQEIGPEERDARASLLELLERRLDAGLERIFKLLGLKYEQKDVEIAYKGLLSTKQEAQTNALDLLDNMLTGDLKRTLLPIIEESMLDTTSEDALQSIKHKILSEMECFELLMQRNDLKIKLAVLYLIQHQKDSKYLPIVETYSTSEDLKVRTFALEALQAIKSMS